MSNAEASFGYPPEGQSEDGFEQGADDPDGTIGEETVDFGFDGVDLHVQEVTLAAKKALDVQSEHLTADESDIEETQQVLDAMFREAAEAAAPAMNPAASGLSETSRILYESLGYPTGEGPAGLPDKPGAATGEITSPTIELGFSAHQADIALGGVMRQFEAASKIGDVPEQTVLLGAANFIMKNTHIPESAPVANERELVAA